MPKKRSKPLPFNQDLGGVQRINRALARKLWSWGLPVSIDAGKGAVTLPRPGSIPENGPAGQDGPFRRACAAAATDSARPAVWRDSIFLTPYGNMCLHFEFADGSNPFVKYGTPVELYYELQAWSHGYRITAAASTGTAMIAAFRLEEKRRKAPLF